MWRIMMTRQRYQENSMSFQLLLWDTQVDDKKKKCVVLTKEKVLGMEENKCGD